MKGKSCIQVPPPGLIWHSVVQQSPLSHPMDCSLPGSSVHGIFQARVLEWGAIAFSRLPFYLSSFPWRIFILEDFGQTQHDNGSEICILTLSLIFICGLCSPFDWHTGFFNWNFPPKYCLKSRLICFPFNLFSSFMYHILNLLKPRHYHFTHLFQNSHQSLRIDFAHQKPFLLLTNPSQLSLSIPT